MKITNTFSIRCKATKFTHKAQLTLKFLRIKEVSNSLLLQPTCQILFMKNKKAQRFLAGLFNLAKLTYCLKPN